MTVPVHHWCVLSASVVAPEIEWSPDQVLTLRAGENVQLGCRITGRPVPQVVWYKDGKEIDKRTMMDIEITTGIGTSSVFIRDADRNHRGVYTVEAKNNSGTKKADVNVRVQGSSMLTRNQVTHSWHHIYIQFLTILLFLIPHRYAWTC